MLIWRTGNIPFLASLSSDTLSFLQLNVEMCILPCFCVCVCVSVFKMSMKIPFQTLSLHCLVSLQAVVQIFGSFECSHGNTRTCTHVLFTQKGFLIVSSIDISLPFFL